MFKVQTACQKFGPVDLSQLRYAESIGFTFKSAPLYSTDVQRAMSISSDGACESTTSPTWPQNLDGAVTAGVVGGLTDIDATPAQYDESSAKFKSGEYACVKSEPDCSVSSTAAG